MLNASQVVHESRNWFQKNLGDCIKYAHFAKDYPKMTLALIILTYECSAGINGRETLTKKPEVSSLDSTTV